MKHKSLFLLVMTLLAFTLAHARTDVTGMWLTCQPNNVVVGQENPFEVLRIKYFGQQIVWTSEWGVGHSAKGRGYRENDGLQLRGCLYQGNTLLPNCDVLRPPIQARLQRTFFTEPVKPVVVNGVIDSSALENGTPLLTSEKTWESLAKACDLVAAERRNKTLEAAKMAAESKAVSSAEMSRIKPDLSFRVNTAFPAFR
jgi:hypothetical protein